MKHSILLGVSGGIAAYKTVELVRLLREQGLQVRVVMTRQATAFVTPLTFQAISGQPVSLDLLDPAAEASMGHITLARWADANVIAPATADFIAKLRAGIADDLLTTICLAAEAPIIVAPAMNQAMWNNPATQDNIKSLDARGVGVFGPVAGPQACGEHGVGRMMEPKDIARQLNAIFQNKKLAGVSVLVSAGPTQEAIDPVRYISNRSSGKMGYAIAQSALLAGADVTLVTGPVALPPPDVKQTINVVSALEMHQAIMEQAVHHQIYIGAAAVADYRPVIAATHKMKKNHKSTELKLERTEDILSDVAQLNDGPFTVGFAAETDHLELYARQKLATKSLDMIAANLVGQSLGGFDSDDNALTVYWSTGERRLEMTSKTLLAGELIDTIAERYHAHHNY